MISKNRVNLKQKGFIRKNKLSKSKVSNSNSRYIKDCVVNSTFKAKTDSKKSKAKTAYKDMRLSRNSMQARKHNYNPVQQNFKSKKHDYYNLYTK